MKGLLRIASLLLFLSKIPILILVNLLLLIVGLVGFIVKDPLILINPAGLVTLLVYNFILALLVLLFIQIPLSLIIILIFGLPPSELLGGFPKGTILYAILSIIIYYISYTALKRVIPRLSIFDEKTMRKIEKASRRRLLMKLLIYIILLILVYIIWP